MAVTSPNSPHITFTYMDICACNVNMRICEYGYICAVWILQCRAPISSCCPGPWGRPSTSPSTSSRPSLPSICFNHPPVTLPRPSHPHTCTIQHCRVLSWSFREMQPMKELEQPEGKTPWRNSQQHNHTTTTTCLKLMYWNVLVCNALPFSEYAPIWRAGREQRKIVPAQYWTFADCI